MADVKKLAQKSSKMVLTCYLAICGRMKGGRRRGRYAQEPLDLPLKAGHERRTMIGNDLIRKAVEPKDRLDAGQGHLRSIPGLLSQHEMGSFRKVVDYNHDPVPTARDR